MKRSLSSILFSIIAVGIVFAANPFCHIRHYDEYDGLSQRLVKQIAEDSDGVLWFATWNGLNRFDGYKFEHIRPRSDDDARAFSERFRDIKPTATGNLWCRIDDKILLFDLSSHRFTDIHSQLEKKLGTVFNVRQLILTTDGRTVIKCDNDKYITLRDSCPVESASMTHSRPRLNYLTIGNRKLGDAGGYRHEELIYSRTDSAGNAWLITRKGEVLCAPSGTDKFSAVASVDAPGGGLAYSTTDSRGNIWLRGDDGAFCLTTGMLPYTRLQAEKASIARTGLKDSSGRIWVSYSDLEAVAVYESPDGKPGYLGRDGSLHDSFAQFGSPVYSMAEDKHGNIWLGSKPDGLFRLTPQSSGKYSVRRFSNNPATPDRTPASNDIYDIKFDSRGRAWLATMREGVDCISDPTSDSPEFIHLGQKPSYPAEAKRVRRLAFAGDTLIIGATTGGLLAFNPAVPDPADINRFHLHTSHPGNEHSLGNIAVMSVYPDKKGNIFIATESDGVNMLPAGMATDIESAVFHHFNTDDEMPTDVAYAIVPADNSGRLLVVGSSMIYILNPRDGQTVTYPASFWHRHMHFTDASPLRLDDGRWLLCLEDDAATVSLDNVAERRSAPPLVITSVSLQNRPDSIISTRTDTIVLSPSERNITINFSALDYGSTEDVHYQFAMDDGDWNNLGTNRSVTFLDMAPGAYRLRLRSSNSSGNWLDNARIVTLIVIPTFWETPAAYCLYVVLILAATGIIVYTLLYIRRIKRKQKELLTAYLQFVDNHANHAQQTAPADCAAQPRQQSPSAGAISAADEAFMNRVMEFVNSNLDNPDAGIDEMAAAAATSRSSLNRKMKSLLGVTPADFIKESRISRAAVLLAETERPVKDIALDCGFSDLNYFGKCFKAARKMSPTAFRREHRPEAPDHQSQES